MASRIEPARPAFRDPETRDLETTNGIGLSALACARGARRGDDAKLIGTYRTEADARGAIERLRDQPGFRHFPDSFRIDKYELNKDHWKEGFVTAVNQPDGTMSYENG